MTTPESNFDNLIRRYIAGEVTEVERVKIEAWLDQRKTSKETELELSKSDEERLFQNIISRANNLDDLTKLIQVKQRRSRKHWMLKIAASVAILLSLSYIIWDFYRPNPGYIRASSKNGIEKLILNDGTLVWLHSGSQLAYFEKAEDDTRHVAFRGEALFEVTKDQNRPFFINYGDVNLKVLGTSFSVKMSDDSIHLKVLTGKVNIFSLKNDINVNVGANERVLIVKNKLMQSKLDQSEIASIISNTEYNMLFEDTPMELVMSRIAEKFNIDIEIGDEQAGKCHITANFTDQSLDNTLQMISEILEVEYSKTGNRITITGNGCNVTPEQ